MHFSKVRRKYFPLQTAAGFLIRTSTKQEVESFLKTAAKIIFPVQDAPLHFRPQGNRRSQINRMKQRYAVLHHEWFLFLDPKGNPVGWHMGETEDAVTFYMRNTGILPKFQNHGIYEAFFSSFLAYLSEIGYERVTSQHQATNRRILIMKLKRGFDVAGLELTENWGPLIKLVRIIVPDRRLSFYRQYGRVEHYRAKIQKV